MSRQSFPLRNILSVFTLTVLLVFSFTAPVSADVLKLKSGEEIKGDIVTETGADIELKTDETTLVIPKANIEIIERAVTELKLFDGREFKGKIIEDSKNWVTIRHRRKSATADIRVEKADVDERIDKIEKGAPELWKRKARTLTKFEKEITFPEPTEKLSRREIMQLHREAGQALQKKDYKTAEKKYQKILKTIPKDVNSLYNLACIYSLTKKHKLAERHLHMAILAGWTDFGHLERDPDLDNIRKGKFYAELLKKRDSIQKMGAQRTLEGLRKEFGENYTYEIDEKRKLIFATNQSMEMLARLKDHLARFADAHWSDNFNNKPSYYITVVCPSRQDFNAQKQKNGLPAMAGGWYNHQGKILICGDVGMTLDHEFTHALHHADTDGRRQRHLIWVLEGLATCFEESGVANGHLIPNKINQRLRQIQNYIQRRQHLPFTTICRYSQQQFMQNAGLCYAQVRYMMVYLYYNDKLRKWYDEYCKTYAQDQSGIKAFENVFGKPIAEIQKDWETWVLGVRQENVGSTGPGGAYVGVQTMEVSEGVAFTRIVADGPAEKAGIEEGDVLVEFGGVKVTTRKGFIDELKKYKPNDTVKVKVKRNNKMKTLDLTLGERPQQRGRR
ncbi:MAG: PDZ domain-containing protein [Planctomycetota bacterium]|jgi:TolA-binding protein